MTHNLSRFSSSRSLIQSDQFKNRIVDHHHQVAHALNTIFEQAACEGEAGMLEAKLLLDFYEQIGRISAEERENYERRIDAFIGRIRTTYQTAAADISSVLLPRGRGYR